MIVARTAIELAVDEHPWVARMQSTVSGTALLLTAEGLSALRQHGRAAFVRTLSQSWSMHDLASPTPWRLLDTWPTDAAPGWLENLLAQPRPSEPELMDIQTADDAVLLTIRIPADLPLFEVHFPQQPILPGIVQLAWAAMYGARYLAMPAHCRRVELLKFQRQLRPGELTQLDLRRDPARACLHFRYADQGVQYSSGRLVWESDDVRS